MLFILSIPLLKPLVSIFVSILIEPSYANSLTTI
nr:MAG TPA: hypothetical protein [Caudoviricetes sp.]